MEQIMILKFIIKLISQHLMYTDKLKSNLNNFVTVRALHVWGTLQCLGPMGPWGRNSNKETQSATTNWR